MMPTNLQIALILLAVLVLVGGLSVAHRMRSRAAHGRDRETPPDAAKGRPDL